MKPSFLYFRTLLFMICVAIAGSAARSAALGPLPSNFDWRDYGVVPPAKDQGESCNACFAFASTAVYESKLLMQGYSNVDLSEQQLLTCEKKFYDCKGGFLDAIQYWETHLPILESCAPYTGTDIGACPESTCEGHFTNTYGYYEVNISSNTAMKQSIYNDGPGTFRFDIYDDFNSFYGDIRNAGVAYTEAGDRQIGGHVVMIIGWSDEKQAWLCQNSAGPTSGPSRDGTFWYSYSGQKHGPFIQMSNMKIHGHTIHPEYYQNLNFDLGIIDTPLKRWHWKFYGASEGRHSSPAFDLPFYYGVNEAVANWFQSYPAVRDHWLDYGIREGRMGSPAFDPAYYIAKYSDLAGKNSQFVLSHWLNTGLNLGRQASEAFDPIYYLANNVDLINYYGPQNYQGAVQHWMSWGIDEGRQTSENFSISAYLNRYPDLQQYFGPTNYRGALIHWFAHGKYEGRSAAP